MAIGGEVHGEVNDVEDEEGDGEDESREFVHLVCQPLVPIGGRSGRLQENLHFGPGWKCANLYQIPLKMKRSMIGKTRQAL